MPPLTRKIKTLSFPFNWRLRLKFSLLPERPTPNLIKGEKWFRAFKFKGKLIPVMVRFSGSVERPRLELLTSNSRHGRRLLSMVSRLHGVEDPSPLYHFMDRDKVLSRIKEALYGFGRAGLMAANLYEGVVKAIIQQQIALKAADHITANIVERFGESTIFMGERIYDFPSPEKLAEAPLQELQACGLSRRKAEYIKGFSLEVASGRFNLEELYGLSPKEIMARLTAFKGLGRWSAELVMAAAMGLNVIPADDLGVRKAFSHYFFGGKLQSGETIRRFAEERFGSFLRDVTVYLLMAYRMGV